MTAVADPFVRIPPLRKARRIVDAELGGKASASEIRWLHDNPVLWLRALHQVKQDVQSHIAKDRTDLAALKPKLGEPVSSRYLDAKAQHDRRTTGRLHFVRLLEARIAEVVSLVGTARPVITGDLVDVMLRLAQLIEDDEVTSARDLALHYADKWARGATG